MTPFDAFMASISGLESGGRNLLYGGSLLSGTGGHPATGVRVQRGPHAGDLSTAAGFFQITDPTWRDYASKLGVTDFSRESQLRVAKAIASDRYGRLTGRSLEKDLASGDPALVTQAARTLAPTWTSLPGGAESRVNETDFLKTYQANLGSQSPLLAHETLGPAQSFVPGAHVLPMGFVPQDTPLMKTLSDATILPGDKNGNMAGLSYGSGGGSGSGSILPQSQGGEGDPGNVAYNLSTEPAAGELPPGQLPEFDPSPLANLFTLKTIGKNPQSGPVGSSYYPPTGSYRG
jgi:muramidase (phage lysozyme)